MLSSLKSFKIRSKGKILDYRLGENLNLTEVKLFFQKAYQVQKIWKGPRHIFGILEKKDKIFFLKLATSEGISVVTKKEYYWNNYFNRNFPKNLPFKVPKNYEKGLLGKKYFYLITDYLEGELLYPLNGALDEKKSLVRSIEQIIEFSEFIQKPPRINYSSSKQFNHTNKFIGKVKNWFNDIPDDIRKEFNLGTLLRIVDSGVGNLLCMPRHGDFTPWHIIKLDDAKLGLVDGEHWQLHSVENYDICYFIQRVFSVLKNPPLAKDIYSRLLWKNYRADKLKTVLAARAIGGFLDESLTDHPDYTFASNFQDWLIKT